MKFDDDEYAGKAGYPQIPTLGPYVFVLQRTLVLLAIACLSMTPKIDATGTSDLAGGLLAQIHNETPDDLPEKPLSSATRVRDAQGDIRRSIIMLPLNESTCMNLIAYSWPYRSSTARRPYMCSCHTSTTKASVSAMPAQSANEMGFGSSMDHPASLMFFEQGGDEYSLHMGYTAEDFLCSLRLGAWSLTALPRSYAVLCIRTREIYFSSGRKTDSLVKTKPIPTRRVRLTLGVFRQI